MCPIFQNFKFNLLLYFSLILQLFSNIQMYMQYFPLSINTAAVVMSILLKSTTCFDITGHHQVVHQLKTLLLNCYFMFFSRLVEIQIQFSIGVHCIILMTSICRHIVENIHAFYVILSISCLFVILFISVQCKPIENWISISIQQLKKII